MGETFVHNKTKEYNGMIPTGPTMTFGKISKEQLYLQGNITKEELNFIREALDVYKKKIRDLYISVDLQPVKDDIKLTFEKV